MYESLLIIVSQLYYSGCVREKEKSNSSSNVHRIANHSSAETKLARFRERWCHPLTTNKRL